MTAPFLTAPFTAFVATPGTSLPLANVRSLCNYWSIHDHRSRTIVNTLLRNRGQ
jgi:hypothetical protein